MAIHLCDLPGSVYGRVALSLLDLAPGGVYLAVTVARNAGVLLPHRFTLTSYEAGGLFSVALSCESPRLAVSQHLTLRSPDLPQFADDKPRPSGRLYTAQSQDSPRRQHAATHELVSVSQLVSVRYNYVRGVSDGYRWFDRLLKIISFILLHDDRR